MCGRYSLGSADLSTTYNLQNNLEPQPRYNITPGTFVPTIRQENGSGTLTMMRWGYEWKDKEGKVNQVINAKAETLHEKPMFRKSLEEKRCLIPATGFYEWTKTERGKIPYFIFLSNQELFSFGGLYRIEHDQDGNEIHSCVIITTAPNDLMKPIHNRMPLILQKEDELTWLTTDDKGVILDLLKPYPSNQMQAHTISKQVNNPINDNENLTQEFSWEREK